MAGRFQMYKRSKCTKTGASYLIIFQIVVRCAISLAAFNSSSWNKAIHNKTIPWKWMCKSFGKCSKPLLVHFNYKIYIFKPSNANLTLRIFPTFASCVRIEDRKTKIRVLFIITLIYLGHFCAFQEHAWQRLTKYVLKWHIYGWFF